MLEDGRVFDGRMVGADGVALGEVVFNGVPVRELDAKAGFVGKDSNNGLHGRKVRDRDDRRRPRRIR